MMKTLLTAIAGFALAVAVVAGGWWIATAQAQDSTPPPLAPHGLTIANGPNAGTATLAWTAVPGVSSYRIGRLSYDDYKVYADSWRERFAYSDVTATSAFTLTGLIPGRKYYFIVGQKHGDGIVWSLWATLTLSGNVVSCATDETGTTPTPTTTVPATGDYDADDDGLIDVRTLAQLDAIRYDLDGDSETDDAAYAVAFPNTVAGMGCPVAGCTGYELVANLDFDTNGNGWADLGDDYWNDGKGWNSIGPDRDNDGNVAVKFTATFDGNGHTIANLYIRREQNYVNLEYGDDDYHGLFGVIGGNTSEVQNVGVVDVSINAPHYHTTRYSMGGLVARNEGATIRDSYVTGTVKGNSTTGGLVGENVGGHIIGNHTTATVSGVITGGLIGSNSDGGHVSGSYTTGDASGSSSVGGLVGHNASGGTIIVSYATGDVSAGDTGGGLVGINNGTITAAYATGAVYNRDPGGLVGRNWYGTIQNSYAIGQVSGTASGGLVYRNRRSTITDSYWDIETTGHRDNSDGSGKRTQQLQSPTRAAGIYANWNPDWWDFGTSSQYPVLKYGSFNVATQRP